MIAWHGCVKLGRRCVPPPSPPHLVAQIADTTKGFDLGSLVCMIRYCGKDIVGCVNDPTCKAALDCLNSCAFNDQVRPASGQGTLWLVLACAGCRGDVPSCLAARAAHDMT